MRDRELTVRSGVRAGRRPPKDARRYHASFGYHAGTWDKPRRVVARVEWHPGELYPRVGFIVTDLGRPVGRVVAFYNRRGTAEQWIREGKNAIRRTRLSCRRFDRNGIRLQLHPLACSLGNVMRTLPLPDAVEQLSLTSLREQLIKIGAKIVSPGRYVTFQMAEMVIPRHLFADIQRRIDRLRPPPFEGGLHVERFGVTFNGLGGFHVGYPGFNGDGRSLYC